MRDLTFDIKSRDKTQGAFDSARRNARAFNTDLDKTGVGMRVAAAAAKAFAAAFTITAVANFGRVVRETVADASALAKVADKVGLSTDALQELRYGFELAGVASGQTDVAMQRFSRRVAEAASGAGELLPILEANNVALRDGDGRMRSQVAILRDYANLIRHAGSAQEQLLLAFKAFDTEGAALVNGLRGGADGLDELMRRTEDAGGVIDEELLRKAEELDDEFDAMWRRFEINSKSSILSAVSYLDQLRDGAEALGNAGIFKKISEGMAGLGLMSDDLTYLDPDLARAAGQSLGPDARIRDAFSGEMTPRNAELEAELARRFGGNAPAGAPQTIIPRKENREKSTKAAKEQVSAYERVMQALQNEQDAIRLNSIDQKILVEQRRAGVESASAEGRAIAAKVTAIETELAALKQIEDQHRAVREAADYLGGGLLDTLFSIADGAETAEEAFKRLGMEILRALTYGALLGQGPFGGLFGGGLLGSLFGGGLAAGGNADPFKEYIVGERGPEILRMGGRGGEVVSNDKAFGRSADGGASEIRVYVDQDGNWQAAVERIAEGPAARAAGQVAKAVPSLALGALEDQRVRKIRPRSAF